MGRVQQLEFALVGLETHLVHVHVEGCGEPVVGEVLVAVDLLVAPVAADHDTVRGDGKEGGGPWEGHREVEEAVPYFDAGTMAVVCGETRFADGARGYLMRRGYPEDCICVLPL